MASDAAAPTAAVSLGELSPHLSDKINWLQQIEDLLDSGKIDFVAPKSVNAILATSMSAVPSVMASGPSGTLLSTGVSVLPPGESPSSVDTLTIPTGTILLSEPSVSSVARTTPERGMSESSGLTSLPSATDAPVSSITRDSTVMTYSVSAQPSGSSSTAFALTQSSGNQLALPTGVSVLS